jgi:hypothetical protein
MISSSTEISSQARVRLAMVSAQSDWVDRCQESIRDRDPMLAADDIEDLAITLWNRPSCQILPPEVAAALLFAGRLSQSI